MKFDFYVTLPSNASMDYYPDNGPSRFTTRMPHEWRLTGEWVVGISEIIFPHTMQHVPENGARNFVELHTFTGNKLESAKPRYSEIRTSIKSGVYQDLQTLLDEINTASAVKGHLWFERDNGGHVNVTKACDCADTDHRFGLARVLCKILGFRYNEREEPFMLGSDGSRRSDHPAALSNGLPSVMFVYTDLCEAHVTGDVQTPLLRVVPVDVSKYEYGCTRLRTFPTIKYIPLLKSAFDTIEILIRDEFGEPLLFDHGTLTVTLHFKRVD